jgi:uncharacterized protein (DUF305 family)
MVAVLAGWAAAGMAQAPIIQPGAPGETPRELGADEAIAIANTSYSPADARFMQDMIPHHHQAIEMAELVADRTNRPELIDVAGRINASQGDEIEFMQQWLRERGEHVPEPTAHDAMHTSHKMAGMATPEQMAELAASKSIDFDRLFLELMITHHEGAVTMVEELLKQPGAAWDPALFEFVNDVTNSQSTEIERMNVLLVGLSSDPRAGLAPGLPSQPAFLIRTTRPDCRRRACRRKRTSRQARTLPMNRQRTAKKPGKTRNTSAPRCSVSPIPTWLLQVTSWSPEAITASTFTGCKTTACPP